MWSTKPKSGFTLIEVLAVMLIITLVASLVIASSRAHRRRHRRLEGHPNRRVAIGPLARRSFSHLHAFQRPARRSRQRPTSQRSSASREAVTANSPNADQPSLSGPAGTSVYAGC